MVRSLTAKNEKLELKLRELKPGDHLCCIYENDDEHRAVLTPFIRDGLLRFEKVIYIADVRTAEDILDYLRDDGLEVERYLKEGQLLILSADETYLKEGVFDPDGMVTLLEEETRRALAEGYSALRVTGEMTWALRGLPGSHRLIEYETKLNAFFPKHRCLAVCQYDRRRFVSALLLDVLSTHPNVILGTKLFENFYCIHPRDLLGPEPEAARLNNWLHSLEARQRTLDTLEESESRFRAITEAIPVPFVISRKSDSVIMDTNEHFARLLGLDVNEVIGLETLDFLWDPDDREVIRKTLKRKGYLPAHQFRAKKADGTPIWTVISIRPLVFQGEQAYISGFYDATDRVRTEEVLQEAHDELERKVVERTEELTQANQQLKLEIEERKRVETVRANQLQFERLIADLSNRFVNLPAEAIDREIASALRKVVEFFGVDRGTLFQICEDHKHMQAVNTYAVEEVEHVPKVAASALFPYFWPMFLSGGTLSFASPDEFPEEAAVDRKSFEKLGVKSNVAVAVKLGGIPRYVLSLGSTRKERTWESELIPRIQLVAELLANALSRKYTEEELRKTELKYRTVADFTYDWVYWIGPDQEFLYVSPACERITGYRPQEFVETPSLFRDIILPEDREVWNQHRKAYYETLKSSGVQFRIKTRGGEIRWIEHVCQPVETPDGTFLGFRAGNRDITDRKSSENALRESEQTLAEAQRIAHLGSWKWDIAKDEVLWSPELYRLLGTSPEETNPSTIAFLERVHPEDRPLIEHGIEALLSKDLPFAVDHRVVLPNDSIRFVHSLARVEHDADNRPIRVYGIAQDVTERKESEEQLKTKDSAIDSSISGVGITDLEGKLIYANDSLIKMWGYESREEVLGRTLSEFWEGEGAWNTVRELREKGWSIGEDVGRRKDGSLFPVQYSASMIKDALGNPISMYGSFLDITEQKRDREALMDLSGWLINAQEDERSRIARELHDDVSQRLALLAVDLDLVGQSPPQSANELHMKTKGLSARVKELSTDLHHLSYRLHPRNIERLGLSIATRSLCREISEQQDIRIEFTSKQDFDSIPNDTALCLYRIAQESLQNVVKHSQAKEAHVELSRGPNEVRLLVSDSGIGFDPLEADRRKGLGLISMRERLRAIGGRLSIRSAPGVGTQIEGFAPLDVENVSED